MAFARVGIEQKQPLLGVAVSRRPILIFGSVFAAFALLAIVLSTQEDSPKSDEEAAEAAIIVPDQATASRVAALQADDKSQVRNVANAPPPSDGNLGVTESVASLPSDAVGPNGTLAAQQRALVEQYELRTQQLALESRLRGRSASLQVDTFAALVRRPEIEAQNALALLEGGGLGGGSQEASGDVSGFGLPALSAGLSSLAAMQSGALGRAAGAANGSTDTAQQADPNFNRAKSDFFRDGGRQLEPGRLGSTMQPGTQYELLMGTVIPGVLLSGINSEAPGQILGQVSENVYDSATGRHLLIPQGSKLVGTYSALVAQGQTRVQVAWVRLNFPDGQKLDLEGMSGADQAGTSGFRDRVNRHFGMRLAAALMTSAITVAYEATQPRNGQFFEGAVHRGVGEEIVRLGTDMARQEAQVPPTLEIRPGYRFSVMVNKDIVFRGPYDDGIARRRSR